MPSFDCKDIPRCTIDFAFDFSPEEISHLSGPVNTLLKSTCLLGAFLSPDSVISSIFDIAEEIAGVEACGYLVSPEHSPNVWELNSSRRIDPFPPSERMPHLVAPASIAAHFGKAVSMDPCWGPWSHQICEAWSSRSLIAFPLRQDRDVVGTLVFGKKESHPFLTVQMKLLWALSAQVESHLSRFDSMKVPSFYSFLDPLTHLYNRAFFENQLDREILRSRRTGEAFSLLLIDLYGFKKYNQMFQPTAGDIALQELAEILGRCVREVDTVVRLGGDEFAIILVGGNAEGARTLAYRILEQFHNHLLPGGENTRTEHLSASVGIASFPADTFDKADLVSKAGRTLVIAKMKGAGAVCLYHDTIDQGSLKDSVNDLPIRKIFDASRSVVNMDKFLEVLLFTGMQGLHAGRGSIVVKNREGDFSLKAAIGFRRHEEQIATAAAIRPGEVTSWVVDHQLPLLVSNLDDSPLPLTKRKNGYRTESFLSIPLTTGGHTLGALHLTNRMDLRPFTREDLQVFSPIASKIAEILDQGMNFRETVRIFTLNLLASLSNALELRFQFLSGHSARVQNLSLRVGEALGMAGAELDALRIAAGLHDVGISGIPGKILLTNRHLNDTEKEMVKKHPFLGAKMLEGIPGLENVRRMILEHHECFDGSGYPNRIGGEDISLAARILFVTEFYDSVLSDRPYRSGIGEEEALRMVRAGSNSMFDPDVVNIFMEVMKPVESMKKH